MAGRRDPERIYLARRGGLFGRLTAIGAIDELDVEHWIERWEREAEDIGVERSSPRYWQFAEEWITNHRAARSTPPTLERQDGFSARIERGEARLAAGQRIERERRLRPRPE